MCSNSADNRPLFSVVIPTHRRIDKLKATVGALQTQTLSASQFEIIVVNDGKDEQTSLWLKEQQIKFIDINHSGPAVARNRGAALAVGDYLAFTDDDALPDSDWLTVAAAFVQREKEAIAFEGPVCALGEKGPLRHFVEHQGQGGFLTCNLFVKRDCFLSIKGFNESFPFPMNEDYELAVRLRERGEILYIEKLIVYHPVYRQQFTDLICKARLYVKQRILSEKFFYQLHPQQYGQYKAATTYEKTLLRQALFYTIDTLRNTPALYKYPKETFCWCMVLILRQLFFVLILLSTFAPPFLLCKKRGARGVSG